MKRSFALFVLGALALGACGGSSSPAAKRGGSSTTTAAATPVAPLTGLDDPGGEARGRPALSIKIDNVANARPQSGVEAADIVWDEVVEGEATRLLAMFNSQVPDVVGPVRSVRLTDPLIVWPVGGVFAYSGGAKYAIDGIEQAPVTLVDENQAGDAMFRDRSRAAPHNLYARPADLFAASGKPVPPPPLFDYASEAITGGVAVTSVHIGFARTFDPVYAWDAAAGVWARSVGDRPFTTKSGAQIAPTNVVVLPVTYDGGVGREGAEAQLVGEGPVKVFTNGRMIEGTWKRSEKSQRMKLVDAAGASIRLTPGSTWVELPDVSYSVDVVNATPSTPSG